MGARRLSLGAMALLVAMSLAGCTPRPAGSDSSAGAGATPASVDMRVGLIPSSASAPIIVPANDGEFAAHGLNVDIQPVTDTAQAMVSVAAGQFEIGNVTMGSAALNAFHRGTDLKIIAGGGAEPPGHGSNTPVVVRTELIDSGAVKSMADLRGRKVAINGKGVIIEYALARALATGNLTMHDVDVQTMPFPDMVAALGTGAIDAGLLLQPTAAQAVAKGVGKILSDDFNQNAQNAVLVANSRFLQQHGDAVTTFLQIYVENIRRMSDGNIKRDDQALAALQQTTNVPPNVMRLAPDPYWPADGRVLTASLVDEQQYFLSTGSLDYSQPQDISQLIDYAPLNAALAKLNS